MDVRNLSDRPIELRALGAGLYVDSRGTHRATLYACTAAGASKEHAASPGMWEARGSAEMHPKVCGALALATPLRLEPGEVRGLMLHCPDANLALANKGEGARDGALALEGVALCERKRNTGVDFGYCHTHAGWLQYALASPPDLGTAASSAPSAKAIEALVGGTPFEAPEWRVGPDHVVLELPADTLVPEACAIDDFIPELPPRRAPRPRCGCRAPAAAQLCATAAQMVRLAALALCVAVDARWLPVCGKPAPLLVGAAALALEGAARPEQNPRPALCCAHS